MSNPTSYESGSIHIQDAHTFCEYHKILLRICDEADRVCEELTEKGKEHFEAYRQAQIDLSIVAEREVFIEAFRLGARLA